MAQTRSKRTEIRHLDLNTTAAIAIDGTLEKAHNIRYGSSGIENVCKFSVKEQINNSNGFTIIHYHEGNYIAIDASCNIHHVDISLNAITSKYLIESNVDKQTLTISHFGSAIFVTQGGKQSNYLLKNGRYIKLRINDITPLDNVMISYAYKFSTPYNNKTPSAVLGYNSATDTNKEYVTAISELTDADYIYGAFYMIFAYRLFDGSIIKGSRAYIGKSESNTELGLSTVNRQSDQTFPNGKSYKYCYFKKLSACKPTITFTIDQSILSNELISSVVIFATRPQQIYDFDTMHTKFEEAHKRPALLGEEASNSYFQESTIDDYAKKPFYEIEEISLRDRASMELTTTLTWSKHFTDIEYGALFTPSFSIHDTLHANMIEYNGRLHTYCQTTKLYSGTPLTATLPTFQYGNIVYHKKDFIGGKELLFTTTLRVGSTEVEVKAPPCNYYYYDPNLPRNGYNFIIPIDNFISYPDHRAESINVYITKGNERELLKRYPLTSSMANNLAYYNKLHDSTYATHSRIVFDPDRFTPTSNNKTDENLFVTKNKIMVSLQNNPFVFEPKNCYDIETDECEIYSLTTSADQITENSFGQHPMLVFTSKGIFALEQGTGEVLYSRTVLLNKNQQYPNTQNITMSGIVFYTTENEVMALSSRKSNSVSKVIEPCLDLLPIDDNIFVYLREARLCALTWYDEIMLINSSYTYAYTYSIKSNSWATRDISAVYIDPNTLMENGNIISITACEDRNHPLLPHIKTNALKLGTDNMKKVEHLSPQLSMKTNSPLTIMLWASNNLKDWYVVGSSEFGEKIGRCGASWRYFKTELTAKGTPAPDYFLYIWAFDIKYTIKYLNITD